MKSFLQIITLAVLLWQIRGQNEDDDDNEDVNDYDNDAPTIKCPVNMKAYQESENSTDWYCDCSNAYLYFPATDSCYLPYTQGPCPPGHYLVLPPDESVSKCEKNPCFENNFVFFNGSCMDFHEPCGMNGTSKLIFRIGEDYQLHCEKGKRTRIGIIGAPPKKCKPGKRITFSGKCKLEIKIQIEIEKS